MNGVELGLKVNGIDGRRIGVVAGVGEGSLRVQTVAGGEVRIAEAAILAVARGAVNLVCMAEGLGRYCR